MKKKLLSSVIALSMTASMAMPVFAAGADTKTSEIPVVGNVGNWKAGDTNTDNPNDQNSGFGGDADNPITPPTNITDISVSVPSSMTFDIVTNTTNSNPELKSADYKVTNNGTTTVKMSGTYNNDASFNNTFNLVDLANVNKAADNNVNVAINLTANGTSFIDNIKDSETSSSDVTINAGDTTKLTFAAPDGGLADVKAEADKGYFKDHTLKSKGNLVLTFSK